MKIKEIWLAAILLCIFTALSYGYEEDSNKIGDVNIPNSMDVVKEGDVNVMVPKGGQLRKESSFLVKEDADEYASRKFINLEARFSQLEKEVASQKKKIETLQETVDKLSQQKK
jgi:hypothetical protein